MPPEALHLLPRPPGDPRHPPPRALPLPSRSARYTGSCDPRRGKLSTLAPRRRPERAALRAIYVDHSTDKRLSFPLRSRRCCTSFLLLPGRPSTRDRKSRNATRFDRITSWKRNEKQKKKKRGERRSFLVNWRYELNFIEKRILK